MITLCSGKTGARGMFALQQAVLGAGQYGVLGDGWRRHPVP